MSEKNTVEVCGVEYQIPQKTEREIMLEKQIEQLHDENHKLKTHPIFSPFRPEIVCLCGSTRFMQAFFDKGWELTLKGKIVLSIGVCKHAESHGGEALGEDVANALDELHKRKIDIADSVFVLNVGGYIGNSTKSEIEYAKLIDKPIEYLEALKDGENK